MEVPGLGRHVSGPEETSLSFYFSSREPVLDTNLRGTGGLSVHRTGWTYRGRGVLLRVECRRRDPCPVRTERPTLILDLGTHGKNRSVEIRSPKHFKILDSTERDPKYSRVNFS